MQFQVTIVASTKGLQTCFGVVGQLIKFILGTEDPFTIVTLSRVSSLCFFTTHPFLKAHGTTRQLKTAGLQFL